MAVSNEACLQELLYMILYFSFVQRRVVVGFGVNGNRARNKWNSMVMGSLGW